MLISSQQNNIQITPVEKFQNKYRIGTKRASWHDYNDGEYFITICTKDRKHYFGEIVDGEMQLSAVGKYTDECVRKISEHNPYAQIPEYVIMPDHIHLIVIISGDDCRNAPWRVSTKEPSPCISADGKNKTMQKMANDKGVASWRAATPLNTTRHHMNQIAEYIENNVAKWESDNSNQ